MRYDRLRRTYQITFCSYTDFADQPDYMSSFSLRNDITGELLCDVIQIVFVELSTLSELLDKPVSEMTVLDKWLLFLQYAPDQKHRERVNEIIESEEVLQMAGNLLMSISQDEVERARFRSRRKFQTDYQSDMATSWDNGKAEGRMEEKITIARNLLKLNLPIEQIASATGMTHAEIENLQ